jgi:YVTN family beta-propeller protein
MAIGNGTMRNLAGEERRLRRITATGAIAVLIVSTMVLAVCATRSLAREKTPRPALLVLNKDASELAIVDPSTLKVVARIGTGPTPHEVAVSRDGRIALATNYGDHQNGTTLSVIDLDVEKEHRLELKDLVGPHGVEFFGDKFYFTAEGSKKIASYNPATNQVDWTHEIGQNRTHMLVFSPGGHTIYTSNVNSDSVTAVVANAEKTQWTNTVIPVGKGPEGIDISPDGLEVWAANSGDGTVSIIDTKTKKVKETISVGTKHSNRVKFAPDGLFVLISDIGSGDLVVINTATRKETKRLHLGSSAAGILIVPDGSKAFVAVSGDNKVAVVDLQSFTVLTTFETGKDPDGLAWRE